MFSANIIRVSDMYGTTLGYKDLKDIAPVSNPLKNNRHTNNFNKHEIEETCHVRQRYEPSSLRTYTNLKIQICLRSQNIYLYK